MSNGDEKEILLCRLGPSLPYVFNQTFDKLMFEAELEFCSRSNETRGGLGIADVIVLNKQ